MTMRPVFGDFLTHVHDDITAAVSTAGELPDDAKAGVIRQLDRLVTTLARYVGDLPLPGEFDPPPAGQTADRGVRETRIALRRSAQVLHSAAAASMSEIPVGEPHPATRHLADAATQLAAGRDLLHTHFAADPATGAPNRTSAWAKAIYAPPVTDALLSDFATMAAQLAPWMMRLSLESPPGSTMPATAELALHDASRWLWTAGLKLEARARHQPPSANGRLVLAAIPANLPPAHQPVAATETMPELCKGMISTAGRLQHSAAAFARVSRWSPQATSITWRRDALAAAITSHSSEVILRALARRAATLGLDPMIRAHLDTTLRILKPVTTAWRTVTTEWRVLSTGINHGKGVSRVAAEIGELALRTGRLAYANPGWTSACQTNRPRDPASLAPTASDLHRVLAGVHHATDTLTHIAATDQRCVRRAATDNRLYIPTRLLPADNDIPYPHVPAPRSRITALLDSYRLAVKACTAATQAFDDLALAAGAPSRVLAAAHTAPTSSPPLPAPCPGELPLERSGEFPPAGPLPAGNPKPGHLEDTVRDLQLTEPALLVRASVLDEATRDLLTEAIAKARHQSSAISESDRPASGSLRPPVPRTPGASAPSRPKS
jgi:hypothetical protein